MTTDELIDMLRSLAAEDDERAPWVDEAAAAMALAATRLREQQQRLNVINELLTKAWDVRTMDYDMRGVNVAHRVASGGDPSHLPGHRPVDME